jgi:hypothetical protein
MYARAILLFVCLFWTSSAFAEELGAQQSWDFVAGKLFAYTCFNGVTGEGRILGDGSVAGTLQLREAGQALFRALPPGTVALDGGAVCAHLAGIPIRPCFRVQKIDATTFRGSVAGLDFAYCMFRQVTESARRKGTLRDTGGKPVVLHSLHRSALY